LLAPGRRTGLIGPNGAGKTTLFRIISGELEPDEGRVVRGATDTVGLLPQDVGDIGDAPVRDFVLSGRADIVSLEHRMHDLLVEIENGRVEDLEKASHDLADMQERFKLLGGYELRARASEILRGMGFPEAWHERPATELSGGWRVRLVLSRLLLQRPTVLLLDEPTNHLDIPSVEWLESFLSSYEGTVVIISHDRYFINQLVNETASIEPDGLFLTPGGYDAYVAARDERHELLEKRKLEQDREIKDLERFVERFRSKASKAAQAQSKLKQLDKIERIELPGQRKKVAKFRFAESERPGQVAITLRGLSKRYGDLVLYNNLDLEVRRDERIALVGPNGAGKTTLLRMMAGRTEPDAGRVEPGHKVILSFFGQHQVEELDLDRTVLGEMEAYATSESMPACRNILGAFMFSGDDVQKKVRVLSGGERNRLALAKLLLRPSNVLLLDEPTNHLDIESRDVLTAALQHYNGTIVFVSHDREFINDVAGRVLHIEAGKVEDYPGNYEYYTYKRRAEVEAAAAAAAPAATSAADSENRKDRRRRDAEIRQELNKRTRDLRAKIEKHEKAISTHETESKAIEAQLADPAFYASESSAKIAELTRRFNELRGKIDHAYHHWTEATEELERVEAEVREGFGG
jgi:ATP-binding cassette subfamily F protein 3